MILESTYFIAQIVAAVAVTASLIFVGIQVRQNTAATKVSNAQASLNAWTELTRSATIDGGFSEVYAANRTSPRSQMDADQLRLAMWVATHLKTTEWNYLQWLEGNLSDELWQGFRGSLLWEWHVIPMFAKHWEEVADYNIYSSKFSAFVNTEIAVDNVRPTIPEKRE